MLNQLIKDRLGPQLFSLLNTTEGAWESGMLLNAKQLLPMIDAAPALEEGSSADPFQVLTTILSALPNWDTPIMAAAVSQKDGGLIVWGDKLCSIEMADGTYKFAMFGEPLPEGVHLSIVLEEVGPVGKRYKRPEAALFIEKENSKGKKIQVSMQTAIAGNFAKGEGAYAQWAGDACKTFMVDQDEADLLAEGLIAPWKEPALGQGGSKVSLYRLAEAIDQRQQPEVFEVIAAEVGWEIDRDTKQQKTDRNGNAIPTVAVTLVGEDNTVYELWPDRAYDWNREFKRGGYGWSASYVQHLSVGRKVYLAIAGLKQKIKWSAAAKAELPEFDDKGQPRLMPNMCFTTTWPKNMNGLLGAKPSNTPAIAPAQPLDERVVSDAEFAETAEIPF